MARLEVDSEIVEEGEVLLVGADLAGVHREVEVGSEIAAEAEAVEDHFQAAGEHREEASAPEGVDSEEGDERILYLLAVKGVWQVKTGNGIAVAQSLEHNDDKGVARIGHDDAVRYSHFVVRALESEKFQARGQG